LEAAQIWWELAPNYLLVYCFGGSSDSVGTATHNLPADCFGGGSDLAGTGSTLFSVGLFWRQLRFGGNWLLIIFRRIVLETAQNLQELAPHYFPGDSF
jgi:hypothetical protein